MQNEKKEKTELLGPFGGRTNRDRTHTITSVIKGGKGESHPKENKLKLRPWSGREKSSRGGRGLAPLGSQKKSVWAGLAKAAILATRRWH